ncbi:hypothetical protein [Micromonospora coerulea]|uniref:hypothetical protein n=1 Tax=Micromonospora coerulea TaxID=47856 RepID=UPI001905AFE8|nr:hypothetical protein [Micromonospora veneta]
MRKTIVGAGFLALALTGIACGGAGSDSKTGAEKAAPSVAVTDAVKPSASQAASKPAAPAKPAKPPIPTIEDGTWTVGSDVPAGTYRTVEKVDPSAGCYWSITKTGSNGANIIQNDIVSGGLPRVTLKKGQDFETNRCGVWQKIG